jgi:riboflavin biosynthesis pyrimidine reductase
MDAHVAGTDAILTDAPGPRRSAQDVGDGLRPPLVLLLGHGAVSPGTDERTMVVTSYRSAAQETPPAPGGQILALPSSGDGVGLEPLLVELGRHEIASCLVIGSASLADALLSQSLVDKIVAGPDAVTPAGFLLRREVDRPAPHRVLYPTAWRQ